MPIIFSLKVNRGIAMRSECKGLHRSSTLDAHVLPVAVRKVFQITHSSIRESFIFLSCCYPVIVVQDGT